MDILDVQVRRERRQQSVVFQAGNSLAVRLVGDCKLPKGTVIQETRDGDRVILVPIGGWPKSFREAIGSFTGRIPRPSRETKQRDPLG